jgi:hypothetical protein
LNISFLIKKYQVFCNGQCVANCNGVNATSTGTKTRNVTKTSDARNGGTCTAPSSSESCTKTNCLVNCVGNWSDCNQSCGPGTKTYTVTTPGYNCEASHGATTSCNLKDCANKWPKYSDPPFSIKLRNTNYCLKPESGTHTPNNYNRLIYSEGCNEDRFKFKVFDDGQIQHYRPPGSYNGGKCIHPHTRSRTQSWLNDPYNRLYFVEDCGDYERNIENSLRYTFENGKIRNKKSGLCFKKQDQDNKIILANCSNASLFDLV